MPFCKGYNHILSIVDCDLRFAFGTATKRKTARKIADASLRFIHLYGFTRFLKTDNGKEFNNNNSTQDVADFQVCKINGRPYHLQSQ
ncbi:hypothetical protein PoB_005528500 [Plakobranchus ocellatus]|uniref:Integrase catalytic domain-containing protein n=1 Tax=Plakobranchus ocellatus TaxID=259542 RepID=A0AAV4C7T9_9GAST|nr:hypothetical protein PoB_005528500 [Plakobranchus ocellatus]